MPFVKGQSGNPKGRAKKGGTLSDLIRSYLDDPAEQADGSTLLDATGRLVSRKEAMIGRLYQHAMSTEPKEAVPAIKLIIEYVDGKPQQTIVNHNIDVTALSDDELKRLAEGK
jgi:hypothetical protein